jgi:L-aminopeptidase/D-esterase-like protein
VAHGQGHGGSAGGTIYAGNGALRYTLSGGLGNVSAAVDAATARRWPRILLAQFCVCAGSHLERSITWRTV